MNDSRDPLAQLVDADRALPEPSSPALDRVWSGIERGVASGAPGPMLDTKPLLAPSAGWGLGLVSVVLLAAVGAGLAVLGARPDAVTASPGLIAQPEWPTVSDPGPEPKAVELAPVPTPAVTTPSPPATPSRAPKRAPQRIKPDVAPKPEPAAAPKLGLADELSLMRAVSQALARGDTTRASTLLREHEEQFPKGALLEERNAAAVRIACARDHASAGTKRAAFEKRWPKSMHAAAIRSACDG